MIASFTKYQQEFYAKEKAALHSVKRYWEKVANSSAWHAHVLDQARLK